MTFLVIIMAVTLGLWPRVALFWAILLILYPAIPHFLEAIHG